MSLPQPSTPSISLQSVLAPRGSVRVDDPKLVQIARQWRDAAGARRMPARRDIDPVRFRRLLPFVFLVDVEGPPLRFRYRLIGTGITGFTGRDLTGQAVDERTYGPYAALAHAFFAIPVEHQVPALAKGRAIYLPGHDWQRIELLVLPLSNDGETVTMILGGYTTVSDPHRRDPVQQPAMEFLSVIPDPVLFDPA